MSWIDLLGPIALASAILLLPGLVMAWAGRARGFLAVALAPGLSTTALAIGAVAAGAMHQPWRWWMPFVTAALLGGLVWAAVRMGDRIGGRPSKEPPLRGGWQADVPFWIALALASTLLARHLRNILGRPDAFSQTFDNIFHLNAVRYIVDTADASSLTLGRMINGDVPVSFYPAAFHDLAALVLQAFPANISVAVNGVLVALVALGWPLSCLALVRLALPWDAPTALGAGVLTASFTTFPIFLLDFGVLYPNLFGLALLPAALGLTAHLLRLGSARDFLPWQALVLLVGLLPGQALAHPNTIMAYLAMVTPLVLWWLVRRWLDTRVTGRPPSSLVLPALGAGAFLVFVAVSWRFIRPPDASATWPPLETMPQALGEALLNAQPPGGRAAWLVSALAVAGIAVALRRGYPWLVGSWLVIVGLWLVVAGGGQGRFRTFMTGIWYNDPYRFSAMITLAAFPLAVLALNAASQWLLSLGRGSATRAENGPLRVAVVASVVGALLALGTQRMAYMDTAVDRAEATYALTPTSVLLTSDEYALLMRVPSLVPPGGVVATNPWNGSSMLYALTGVKTTTTHVQYASNDDQTQLRFHLDDLATSPEACEAARHLRVTHALDFGTQEVHGFSNPYPGFDDLGKSKGFRLVERQGAVALYELTLCR